jgi:hypothetical protein
LTRSVRSALSTGTIHCLISVAFGLRTVDFGSSAGLVGSFDHSPPL